jgi:hypothetical protein
MGQTIEERISTIQFILKEMFPEAESVTVFVNCEGIQVKPEFRTNIVDCSRQNISGNWIKQA